MPKRKQGEVQHGEVQDFELIQLLIQEVYSGKGASTSIAQRGKFESFKARFQSYIDQIPSYLHSVSKEGFFPHFFLGSFSILPDTQIAEKLGVKKVYFRFDTAKTLKVVVVKNSQIRSDADAIQGIGLFSISEDGNSGHQFTSGELEDILKENLHPDTGRENKIDKVRVIKDRIKGTVKSKLVQINKSEKSISVETQDKEILDSAAGHRFHEIKKEEGIWKDLNDNTKSKPEDYIAELTDSNVEKVKKSSGKVLSKISEVHSKHKGSFIYADKAREAAHHGFVAGALVNFRYRYNLRVYLEQFAGRGYADIVLVPRGKDRSLNAVPIIIELKAGTGTGTTPGSALEQAKGYAKGFQPNTMRVLTVSDNVLCVGLNLDSTEKFSMYISSPADRKPARPTIQKLLEVTSSWSGEESAIADLKKEIKQPLEHIYHTFPGTPEKGGSYFSRFMLGQLLLADKFVDIDLEKSVFLYNEYPLASSTRLGPKSTGRPVTTFMLTKGNQGQDKEVFIFHIREGGKGEFSEKKIPINLPAVGKITEVCISLQEERKSDFFNAEKVNRYNSLNEYKQGKSFFGGEWKKIPYPAELKEKFDAVLESQLVCSQDRSQSIGKYKELFGRLGEAVLPFKVLIEREAHTQAVFHGAFSHYSDIKLGESQENRALILTEFQTGRGKRIDMVVHGISTDKDGNAKEYDPVGLELKGPREGKTANALKDEANKQISDEYTKGVTYKTLTDGKEVAFMGVVFDKGASNADSLILMSKDEFASVKVIHSSIFSFSQQQPGKRFDPNSCVGQSSRSKRSINNCLFSKGDVEKFSKGNIDENNVDKIKIDSEKFLTYVKNSQDEGKNAQLIEFIGNKNIEGDYKYLVDKVIGDQGYERYIQNERIKDLQGDVLQQNSGLTKNPKLKGRLMNAAGGIQLIRGIHGAIVSCKDGTATDCGLNLGGIGWSFASQPIENVMVKIAPKVVESAGKVAGKIIPGVLGKQTKFAVQVAGVKFGSKIAKGAAGAITGVFDIVDIGMSASNLVDCKKRESSDNPCGEKEIRDNIASISFSGVSFVSGVALTAAGMPVVGIAVGFGIMVAHGVYSGISNIVEYEEKYDTTHDENWRIFWHTFAFQPIPEDVQHLAARKEMVNSLTKGAWQALNNSLNSTVAYGIGFGKVSGNTLCPDYAKILMNKEERANTRSLSRVIPHRIEDASRICLPQVTDQDYEKAGTTNSFDFASYYCENSMVISHNNRVKAKQKDNTIVYDLKNINEGKIIGNNKWNNNFLIDSGIAEITGGNKVVNRFVVNNIDFSGKIIGGSNSVNILDLSQLKDTVVGVNVNYRFKPNASGLLKVRVNGRWLINDQIDNHGIFNYHYVGRKNKVDEVLCMGYSEHFTESDNRDVIIDSGGGLNRNKKEDVVESCRKVIISPYTKVKGGKGNYTFYVKTADYKGRGLYSEINVDGTGTVVFSEIDLLSDCDQITYSKESNTLSLKINFGQNNQFTLDVKNYVEQSSNKPNFVLIDKNGSNIVPKIEKSDSSTVKINSFELHSEYSLDKFDDVETHYKKILNNNKNYKALGVIREKTQSQDNNIVPHMVFGSSGNDVINFDQGTIFARGGEGSDVYVIADDISNKEVKIDNNSDDEKMDTLFIPEVEKGFSIQKCDLHLNYGNISIQVKNYLQDHNHRHFIIMNKKGEAFIPNIQSMSCSSSGKGKLVPFLQATQTQNMFLLPKDFADDHVVIDSRLEDIEKYKDKDDLLLIRESEIPFIIRIEGFYTDRSKWENASYFIWNNNDFVPSSGLLGNIDNVMEYKDKLRDDYKKVVKEYIIDLSNSTNIEHNQKLERNISTFVGQEEERIGVMILKNIAPNQIEVSSSGTDLIFFDKRSNHTVNIKGWNNSNSYRISRLEFDLGLEPITFRRLNRFGLSKVRKIHDLIEKASENYKNRGEYTPKVENDFKCLMSVDGFERGNTDPVHQCLGFPSLQNRVSFTENSCSLEQIEELKNKTPSSNQILTLLEKLENNLLLNGYDSNITDQCNKWMITSGLGVLKPLVSTAVDEGKWDEVETLLDKTAKKSKAADVEHKIQCSQNWTALNYAVYNGNVELSQSILKPFLKKKGDINALTSCNDDNWALLHYAVHYDNLDMVSFLIDKGAKVDIQSKKGKTPLYLAIEEAKQLDIVKLLLDRGANIKIKYNGRTPLYLAACNGNLGITTFLCDRIKAESHNSFKIKQIKFLKEEVVNQANIPSDTKRLVESCISSLRDSIKSEAERVLKDGMLNGRSASTIEFVNKVYNFDKNLFGEAIKEAVNRTYSSVGIEGILKFIGSYHYISQFIPGYVAVFDKIPKNDGAMFKLAYSIRETMKMPRVSSEEKSDLERLKNKLPESVRNTVFSSAVCIKNVEYGRYLYSPNSAGNFQFDDERRYVFTWSSKVGNDGKWKVELNGDNVYLRNVEYGRYLYSPNSAGNFQFDDERRYVFTWSSEVGDDGKWKVELNGDNVYLRNVEYGRYLYSPNSAGNFQFDSDRRYVFTWPSNGGSGQFKWKIEDCGSTRKRRSIQKLNGYNQTVVDYQSILTEENSQQIASRISAIVEDVERHTFLNQSKNKLDLDSYLNDRGRSNAADSMRRDVCSELNASGRRNIVLSGNDVCAITSGHETLDIENFPIQEVVINDDAHGKKSLRSTLDLHQLVQQINRDLSIKPIPTVIKGKSDLLIKLSISATGLQQDVITVRLKDALLNKWYKKLQIIFDNAPMEIDDSLGLKSSFFISDEKIIVVTPQDIEEKNKLVISKKAGQYTYLHDKYDLIVTNAFNANIEASELCIIYFRDFYKEPKMKTLSIRFIDKEILLSNEVDKIHNSDSIDKLNNVSSIVNSQESSIHSEVPNSGDINAQGKLDRTLLHLASEAGEFDKVKLLLDRGANIEVQDKFGYTPIFLATQSGKWSIVKLLLDRGANIDAQDEKGQTLLHFAASGNNLDMVQFLLNRGANIEVQDKFAWTPILSAAQSGKWDVVKLLISNGAKFNNEITIQGTPLHFAVQEGNLDIIRFLLDRGASVNAKDENNKIPLDLATKEDVKELLKRAQLDQGLLISAQDGNLDKVVEYFIRKRVSLKVKDRDGKTPLDLAEQKGHTDIAKVIKQMQLELDKKLLSAVKNGDLNKVEDFISQGTSLEVKDSNGNTLLHYASQNDHLEVVEYLIKKGASLKTKNKDGKAPLDLALQKNYISIIEFLKKTQLDLDEELLATVKGDDLNRVKALVSQGASLEAKDNSNNTPLHNACNNGHVKVVEYLIQEGASLKAKNKDGEAPLHVAVQYDGTLEVIEFILSRDLSDINDITNSGKTPLHLAIREDKPNTVQLLLRKGASIAVKDKNGKTSLDLAKQEDYTNIVEMIEEVQSDLDEGLLTAVQDGNLNEAEGLVSRNANVNTRDKYSWTPLHWAAYKGHLEVAEFLVKKGADVNAASENLYGRRPIHIAIENNNKNIIEFLLSKEVGINDTDKQGYTPLHYAAWRGRLEVARFLIEKGADINAADTSTAGKKPIHVAAENNSESVIEFLLEKGVSVDEADKNGWTPLHYAARFGQPEVAKFLIEKGADINVAEVSIAGKRPIHVATEKNNKDIIEFFLSKGVSVNDTDKDSRTPLHWASWSGHLDLVKYFIDKGANINAECNDSKTPLDVAIDLKYNNVVEYLQRTQLDLNEQLLAAVQGGDFKKVKDLVSRGASLDAKDKEGKIPLHFAAQEGSLGMVQFFLDRGANIRAKDMYGWTPLHFAASSNKFDIVKFLFDKNANIKARDTYGDTPLHVAAQYSNKLEIVEFLLDNNANDINNVNNNGSTPLHVATQGNKPSTVKLLLNRGARIEVKDSCNRTPLDLAKQEGYTNIVRMIEQRQSYLDEELLTAVRDGNLNEVEDLVSHNANVNTTDIYSWTPLHWATFKDHLEIARFLIKKGADINAADKGPYGEKPIHVAAENNSKDIIEFFLSKGVGINDTDKQGYTPLHYAAWRGCLEVVKFLIEEYANSIFKYNNGSTLPCNASLGNHLDIIKCSIGEKNIFEIRDNSGRVPLHCAASNGKLDIVKYFIDEEKVDVNIKDNGYWTPLHWASWGGHLDVAKYLVDKRANINAKDKGSKIPLNVAIDQKHNDVVKYLEQAQLDLNKELLIAAKGGDLNKVIDLISKGANVKDNNDDTPLHLAVGYLDVVKYLINKGANINAKRKAGKTTLDIARDRGHNNVINYLEKELNQERGSPAKRKLRHLAVDLSDQPEIAASSGIRPSSWMGSCISWAKNLVASTFSIIPGLPTQYNIADKNNVKSDNKNIPQSTASVDWNNFLNNENIALASCVADALDDTSSKRYQNLISKGVEVVPNSKIAVEFALRKFDLFVEGKIRNLGSKEQARIHVELKDAYPEIIASLERGVEFSGNVGLDNVLEKCKKRFCANVLQKDKVSTCLSEIGVTKLGGNLNR